MNRDSRLIFVIKFLAPFLMAAVASCSWLQSTPPPVPMEKSSVEVFMSRSSITKTEFEHYKVDLASSPAGKFFFECGEVRRGENIMSESDFARLSEKQATSVTSLVEAVKSYYQEHQPKASDEGSATSFSDPGKFEIQLASDGSTFTYRSSFDAVSGREGLFEERLFDLVKALRSIPGYPPCSNSVFFGMPRQDKQTLSKE